MINKQDFRLKCMYIYNIIITSGFTIIIILFFFFPKLRILFAWEGSDPIIFSLIVPFYIIIVIFSVIFMLNPKSGVFLLKMQIYYKPFTIAFIIYFVLTNKIHILWAIIIIIGLLGYIFGNIWAVYLIKNNK